MHISTRKRIKETELNMTPMIDVVFLLIIFFLVSSHLVQQDTQMEAEELNLPSADSGQPTEEDQVRRVVINVLPAESGGRFVVGGRPMTSGELSDLIAYGKRADRQLEVRIRADRTVPYRVVEPLMVTCAEAGVWKVTFAVVEGRTER